MTPATLRDEIRAAYQAHRLTPVRKSFFVRAGGCSFACPLVALAIHRGAVGGADPDLSLDGAANPVLGWAAGEFGDPWAWGSLDGFDGRPAALADPDYLGGHRQGALAAREVLAGGGDPDGSSSQAAKGEPPCPPTRPPAPSSGCGTAARW
jgi:hypothetical protein